MVDFDATPPITTAKAFTTAMRERRFGEAVKMVRANSKLPWTILYTSVSCQGAWGMATWKHFGAYLQNETYANITPDEMREVKDFARFMSEATPPKDHEDFAVFAADMLLNYAVTADWLDVAADCLRDQYTKRGDVPDFMDRARSAEMKDLLRSHVVE